ncbi:MAG: hypothetical protein IPL14_14395 [Nitrospira sp.]|nr:hypothetical protein [Nitrospira sp.]
MSEATRASCSGACACGGSSGLSGTCEECEKKKLIGMSAQAKLRINEPGDEYEQEADRVAEQVMRMPIDGAAPSQRSSDQLIQRRLSGAGGLLSRAAAEEPAPVGEQPASDGAEPKEGTTDEGGSRCPSWRADPQSISKRAAENYVQHDITPTSPGQGGENQLRAADRQRQLRLFRAFQRRPGGESHRPCDRYRGRHGTRTNLHRNAAGRDALVLL